MVLSEKSDTPFATLVLPESLKSRIHRIIHEYRQQAKLKKHGLSNRRKILLSGPPGTGKTLTARVLAHELRLPLHTIQVDKLVTKFMGETSAKLRQIFNLISEVKAVYLFDEFDAIGGDRSLDNDVGEMRRVLNALLQFIEQDASDSMIIGATNNPALLDRALFRRFDDVIHYEVPDEEGCRKLIENVLGAFKGDLE
jgi:SpoVK/Ycf46/Vps4 family AAA+-type ATPase